MKLFKGKNDKKTEKMEEGGENELEETVPLSPATKKSPEDGIRWVQYRLGTYGPK